MKRFLPLTLFIVCATVAVAAPSLTPVQEEWLKHAKLVERDGWKYLHVEGGGRERGFQHGYLLANDIQEAIRIQARVWEYDTAVEWPWLVERSVELFEAKIDSEDLAEIDGIAEGMNAAGVPMTRAELIAWNGSSESIGYWWPTVKDSIAPNAVERRKESCSAFIATGGMTADGRIVLAHNTWSTYYYAVSNVVIDIKPAHGHRILMQTSPGLIHSGTDFFITDAGLVGAETTIDEFTPFDPSGVPEFCRMRRATQDASSIDEWCAIMKKGNNGGYANAWLLGDTRTNEIAWLELGLKYVGFKKTRDGYFTGSNVAEDPRILRMETKMDEMNIKNADIARRVRWGQLMKERRGKIDRAMAEQLIGDHVDTYLNTNVPDGRTICGHGDLDAQASGLDAPYYPLGAYDGKVVDAGMAEQMTIRVRWGAPCGTAFDAGKFLEEHPQYGWMAGLIKDRPVKPWTDFHSGE
jgi:hypothetical protein